MLCRSECEWNGMNGVNKWMNEDDNVDDDERLMIIKFSWKKENIK